MKLAEKGLTTFENNAVHEYYHIFKGMTDIKNQLGKTAEERDYLESAMHCLRLIGNVHPVMYGFTGTTDSDGHIYLPCGAIAIEYVSDGLVDWVDWSGFNQMSQYRPAGNLISYRFLRADSGAPYLETEHRDREVSVAFRSWRQSGDNLPMVTESEALACAYFWNFIDVQRRMYSGDAVAANLFAVATQQKNQRINQARTDMSHMSQNLLNQYADVIYSQNWKQYNRSYKPIQLG